MAARKSAFTAPGGVRPWTISSNVKLHAVVFDSFDIAGILHLTGSGRGCSKCTKDLKICEHVEGGLDAEEHHHWRGRATPPKNRSAATPPPRRRLAAISRPASFYTMYTPQLWEPPSSADRAAGEGGGIPRTPGSEVELVAGFRKTFPPHCR
jgi:hypothetical protein